MCRDSDSVAVLRPGMRAWPEETRAHLSGEGRIALGTDRADEWLGGGLARDGLHEAYAAQVADGVAATGFALSLAWLRARKGTAPMVWIREKDRHSFPYGPGLQQMGIAPEQVSLLTLPDAKAVLRAATDCARDGAAAAILMELAGKQPLLDLTASRRLVLAAGQSDTMLLLVRHTAKPAPSSAHTRWRVASAPSRPLPANAPGRTAFDLALLRHRGGRDGLQLVLEWDNETASFEERIAAVAPVSGAGPAMAIGGTGDRIGPLTA